MHDVLGSSDISGTLEYNGYASGERRRLKPSIRNPGPARVFYNH